MPESRDRLQRTVDVAAAFARRRHGILEILTDEADAMLQSPVRAGITSPTVARGGSDFGASGRFGGVGRASLVTPRSRNRRFRYVYGSGSRENGHLRSGGRGRGRGRTTANSVLPSWYPRTPLQDITTVVRAIERSRARLRETEGQQHESPINERLLLHPSVPVPAAQLEQGFSSVSSNVNVGVKPQTQTHAVGKIPKLLLGISGEPTGESDEFLTPQKKLLASIDTVEKVVMEELNKLKRTPSAKKAERERKVRTLMSMR